MAQPQVVNIQAMYQIGKAAEWRPDETPKFMGWVEKALGTFAVDLLHDAWDTKKSYLKQNSLNAQGVEDMIQGGIGMATPWLLLQGPVGWSVIGASLLEDLFFD